MCRAAQPPYENVADGLRGAQFTASGGAGQQGGRVVAGLLGVGEGGGDGVPAGFAEDLLGQFRQGLAELGGMEMLLRWRKAPAALCQSRQRCRGGSPVGGTKVVGGLAGGGGLLCVAPLGVPVCCGGEKEEQHVDGHRGRRAVFAVAEGGTAVDEVAGRLAQGAVVSASGTDVGA